MPAGKKTGGGVRSATGHQPHPFLTRRIGTPPLHGKLTGNRRKGLAKTIQIKWQRVSANLVAHKKPATLIIRMMTGFGNPAVIGGQKVTHLSHNSNPIRTGNDQSKSTHQRLRGSNKVGHSSLNMEKLQYSDSTCQSRQQDRTVVAGGIVQYFRPNS